MKQTFKLVPSSTCGHCQQGNTMFNFEKMYAHAVGHALLNAYPFLWHEPWSHWVESHHLLRFDRCTTDQQCFLRSPLAAAYSDWSFNGCSPLCGRAVIDDWNRSMVRSMDVFVRLVVANSNRSYDQSSPAEIILSVF